MIDFTAFPVRKQKKYLWIKIPSLLAGVSILISLVMIGLSGDKEREIGLSIFLITTYVIMAVASILLIVIPIWFIAKVILPRLKNIMVDGPKGYVPVYNNTSLFEQFSVDNGFRFTKYALQTPAPHSLYDGLFEKSDSDDVYVFYQIEGMYEGIDFSLYCLGLAEGKFPGSSARRGFAYSHDIDGRRIEYVTVLSSTATIPRKRIGVVKVLKNKTNTFIFCSGYLNDREILKKMFKKLASN